VKRIVIALSFFSLFVIASAAQAQYGAVVTGRAYWYSSTGVSYYASYFQLKVCKADAAGHPTSQCTTTNLTQYGDFTFDVGYGTGYYFLYLWRDDIYVGSSSYPMNGPAYALAGPSVNYWTGSIVATPAALPPTRVYPAEGQVNTPTSFTLQWTDGRNYDRNGWSITYDIYGSGNEFPENLAYSNIPCNGVGTCSLTVSNLAYTTRYQWRVVARMHSGPVISGAGSDNSYLTSSATFHFSTTWDPATPTNTISTFNGSLLRAVGGGGGALDAAGSSSTYETQFKPVNTSGSSSLYSGDQIYIQTNRNYHLSATNGGGSSVNAQATWTGSWELFTIERIAGFGAISSGDQVDFKAANGNYMSAEGGGGGAVNANRTAIGPWETFVYH
jgi:hypothetical protein